MATSTTSASVTLTRSPWPVAPGLTGAVPHLSARMVRDKVHLRELLVRLEGSGVERAFVVGGDSTEPGDFPDGLSLLRAMADIGHPPREVGIPCYPEGHAFIPDDVLLEALAAKAPYAQYMTTQLCFDPGAIGSWLGARRAEGFRLPVEIGLPGVAEVHKLVRIATRIGVRDSTRFLAKNAGLVARLLRPGGFRPDDLLTGLAPIAADPVADRAGGPRGAGRQPLPVHRLREDPRRGARGGEGSSWKGHSRMRTLIANAAIALATAFMLPPRAACSRVRAARASEPAPRSGIRHPARGRGCYPAVTVKLTSLVSDLFAILSVILISNR